MCKTLYLTTKAYAFLSFEMFLKIDYAKDIKQVSQHLKESILHASRTVV